MDLGRSPTPTNPAVLTVPLEWNAQVTSAYQTNRENFTTLASRIVGHNHAADVVQEMFIRVWANPATYDETRGNLTRFMYMVTRGISIDHLRTDSARQARDVSDHRRTRPTDADAGQAVTDTETRAEIRRALCNLRDNERDLIIAAYFRHLTYREVATEFDLPEGTVKSRIRLGLFRLRVELRGVDGRHAA